MKTRTWIACLACGVLGFIISSLSQPQLIGQERAKEPRRMKWEYKVESVDENGLNELGEEGWDLVTVQASPGGAIRLSYLRRQKL